MIDHTGIIPFILLTEMLINTISCNTVDQLLSQISNLSSSLDLHELELYAEELEQRYFLNRGELQEYPAESFWLYTRENPESKEILKINDPFSILDSNFSSERITVVLVHGWLNAGNSTFMEIVKNLYLDRHDYNIICVDWSVLASNVIYPVARYSIKFIGSDLATMLATIVRVTGYDWEDFHLVGHSLGAHVCGIAGENVKTDKIGRITGLDPALPLFTSSPEGRLDPTDAAFVDIIHTCGGYLGFLEPCGHVDFYPNGGTYRQPGCGFEIGTCSHTRSYVYFAESLMTRTGFYSQSCDTWDNYVAQNCNGTQDSETYVDELVLMGEYVNTSARGTYFLMTASSEPYALGLHDSAKTDDNPDIKSSDFSKWLYWGWNFLNALKVNG